MTSSSLGLSDEELAREVAMDLADGTYVNLGIGLPQTVAQHIPSGREVVLHSENGILGVGPPAPPGEEDWNVIDAGKRPITLLPGGCFISHSDSFAIIRGGHLDTCVLGAYEVSAAGDIANWWTGQGIPAVGGAMDLCRGTRTVLVMMRHTTPSGRPKIVEQCALPLTAPGVVTRVYTELGIFIPQGDFVEVVALCRGCSVDELAAKTGARVSLPKDAELLELPRRACSAAFG